MSLDQELCDAQALNLTSKESTPDIEPEDSEIEERKRKTTKRQKKHTKAGSKSMRWSTSNYDEAKAEKIEKNRKILLDLE